MRSPSSLYRLVFLPDSRLARWTPVALWALFIFILSSIPGYRYPEVKIVQFDKVVHFCLYLPLGLALARALAPATTKLLSQRRHLLPAIAAGALYGVSDELHQLFVPNRSCSIYDWMVDLVAVSSGALLWQTVERAVKRPRGKVSPSAGPETA